MLAKIQELVDDEQVLTKNIPNNQKASPRSVISRG